MSDAKPWISCGRCEQITNGIGEAALLPKHAPRCHATRWRSMESAPRDGTRIWLAFPSGGAAAARWEASGGRLAWRDHYGNPLRQPTAWMPLPDPPTGEVEP